MTLFLLVGQAYAAHMRKYLSFLVIGILFTAHLAAAASKPHVVAFGKWSIVRWTQDGSERALDLKIRGLFVDTRLKEYTVGQPHDVTDRLFVVRRVFRLNDALPGDASDRWIWQRGGWILVDRLSGRVSQLTLPEFDSSVSVVSWFRDYAAYCGVADDGKQLHAMLVQLGRRKPILKKSLDAIPASQQDDPPCAVPEWQRAPMAVIYSTDDQKLTYSVRAHTVDLINDAEEEEGE